MKMQELTNELKKLEKEREEYKGFLQNYSSDKGDYLMYLYLTNDYSNKDKQMMWEEYLFDFIEKYLISEKNMDKEKASSYAEELSLKFDSLDKQNVEDCSDKSIKAFIDKELQ